MSCVGSFPGTEREQGDEGRTSSDGGPGLDFTMTHPQVGLNPVDGTGSSFPPEVLNVNGSPNPYL